MSSVQRKVQAAAMLVLLLFALMGESTGFMLSRSPLGAPHRQTLSSVTRRKDLITIHNSVHDSSKQHTRANKYDVTILGGGPAGTTLAWMLQEQHRLSVAMVDPRGDHDATWYPNYGEWQDEWYHLADRLRLPELRLCTTNNWENTDCFFGGDAKTPSSHRTRLSRPYVRVDRVKLQKLLRKRFREAAGDIIPSKVSAKRTGPNIFDKNLVHHGEGTSITLDNGQQIETRVIIDATGFESQLVAKENPYLARGHNDPLQPGYQIAYGFIANCSGLGPYAFDAMTLFDYRTDHLQQHSEWLEDGEARPTFMYVMPLGKNPDGSVRAFWEETSLVGVGKRRLSFEECKSRAMQRLKYHGISVLGIEEEEYCYIPMGGELPSVDQRIIPFGGAANMVHPSTGYHVCRMMAAAPELADCIARQLRMKPFNPDRLANAAIHTMWDPSHRLQREFQAFGGDFLMRQNVHKIRSFFSAFFALDQKLWSGFLAGWPGLPNNQYHDSWDKRFLFALGMLSKLPIQVSMEMIVHAFRYTVEHGPYSVLRSLLPPFLFGKAPRLVDYDRTYGHSEVGDVAAKEEARRMMKQFQQQQHSPASQLQSPPPTLLKGHSQFPAPFDDV